MSENGQENPETQSKSKSEAKGESREGQDSQATPEMEIEGLSAEAEKWKTEYLYLRAEFDNYRKQAIKERSEMVKYGSERVLLEMLTILDNFERAMESSSKTGEFETYKKGVEMTVRELRSALGRFGVEEIPALGKPFDPAHLEALSSQETEEHPPGHVVNVFKKAYKLHDRVLRPGQVVVAKEKAPNEDSNKE